MVKVFWSVIKLVIENNLFEKRNIHILLIISFTKYFFVPKYNVTLNKIMIKVEK